MTELEALRARYSVRSYKAMRIETEKVSRLNTLIEQLNREGDLKFRLLEDAGDTFECFLSRVLGLVSAPSVIICAGHDCADLNERVGYYGQKLVLNAQAMGLNTCWVGAFNTKSANVAADKGDRVPVVIAIGYGTNNGRSRRSKTPQQVVKGDINTMPEWFRNGVDAALLAPTAVNRQRFEITLREDGSVVVFDTGGTFSTVDKGIVRYNFEIGAGMK